ncbi:farnesylcysteine lyase-like [Telopea speciosissima]|uniref:farnesylcysteine lyase-like n=1 Tax=Telopea speciosissima TaxID=54955 RepID=UPI001CC4A4E7|nr:farnesylcysteine lyase-like [Telopea speciosissima]
MVSALIICLLLMFSVPFSSAQTVAAPEPSPSTNLCIIGSGIAGSSVAHFLRRYSADPLLPTINGIRIFERHRIVGGRMATVSIGGDTLEAGASKLHPKNYHALNFTKSLNLLIEDPSSDSSDSSFGIWDGTQFVFKTLPTNSKSPQYNKIVSIVNSLLIFFRYGFSLYKMQSFVDNTVGSFLKYYTDQTSRPVFETVDEMLKWSGLYGLTRRTLQEELVDAGLSPRLISELVTVITRVNYGQSVAISGLAGAVSLAGSDAGLWSVGGGNWQIAAGLINSSDVTLHLNEEIGSITHLGDYYELNSTKGISYACEVTVVATPLDELNIQFHPPILIPERKLQHTHATFVRGLLNPAYFGLHSVSEIPELVGTIEAPDLPFSSISILKKYTEEDMSHKIFSRMPLTDALLDQIFSVRKDTVRIDWGAYPHFTAPEVFAPFVLDGLHLYYINAFENAASTMETSAVAAENVARLILSRLSDQTTSRSTNLKSFASGGEDLHFEV